MEVKKGKKKFISPTVGLLPMQGETLLAGSEGGGDSGGDSGNAPTEGITNGGTIDWGSAAKAYPGVAPLEF